MCNTVSSCQRIRYANLSRQIIHGVELIENNMVNMTGETIFDVARYNLDCEGQEISPHAFLLIPILKWSLTLGELFHVKVWKAILGEKYFPVSFKPLPFSDGRDPTTDYSEPVIFAARCIKISSEHGK